MSIRALYYITGDTQQSGFRRIGSSEAFPADTLPYLNNGESIQERARVESASGSTGSGGGVQLLSHVWEYQTGKYGYPVAINTMVAIGTGRAHAFSEYVAGDTENVAELADAGRLIAASDKLKLLDVDRFMAIPGRELFDCPEDAVWEPVPEEEYRAPEPMEAGDEWRKTVLSHYWKQASIRAFSMDSPATVRVNLGEFSEDQATDTEATIEAAKKFFVTVIVPGLPKQVQNIASMAAGVNAGDICTLYTAIEFDIARGLIGEGETLRIERLDSLGKYKLSGGELDFITDVSNGKTPKIVQKFFDYYREQGDNREKKETEVPFMADYRVWYALYCMDRVIHEKHEFITNAKLNREHGNNNDISDARACFLLMSRLRKILERDHGLERSLVTTLLEELETGLLGVMLEDMKKADAKPFLLRKNEMLEFHRKTLYIATDDQVDMMIALAVRDAEVSPAPQFVRCYPETPVRDEKADARNAKLLSALLPAAMTPLIQSEIDNHKEKPENKYLRKLGRDEDGDQFLQWAHQRPETNDAVSNFLRAEIENADKHFLLYGLSKRYLPGNELLQKTFKHLTNNNSTRSGFPNERRIAIAADGKVYIEGDMTDTACVAAMNRYYQACFRDYRANIGNISDPIIKKLGGDTTGAMVLIFEEYKEGKRLTGEEAKAVFDTFCGDKETPVHETVKAAYTNMIARQRKAALANPGADRKPLIAWLGGMIEAAKERFEIDTSEDMAALFSHASSGERMKNEEAVAIFNTLGGENGKWIRDSVIASYTEMLKKQRINALSDPAADRRPLIRWLGSMIEAAPFDIDTSEDMAALFEHAADGERMTAEEAENVFTTLDKDGRYTGKENVAAACTRMIAVHQAAILGDHDADREAARESMVRWVSAMIGKCPFKVDTSESIKAVFEDARTGERISRGTAQQIFDNLMDNAVSGEDKVRAAFHNMIRDQLDAELEKEKPDPNVLEWIGTMIKVADKRIEYDTTDILKKIFESAKQGERMKPSDAVTVLNSMRDKAEGLNSAVQRVYNEMLTLRRKEIVETNDMDGFQWLCEMVNRTPWTEDAAWLAEQHTDNIAVLCDISSRKNEPIDSNSLNTVRMWLEKGELTPQGATKLQKYCNAQLDNGETAAADAMIPHFGIIDGSCEKLRGYLFDSAARRFTEGLKNPDVSFGALVSECSADVEKAGKPIDELYRAAESETEEYLKGYFENNSDLTGLGRELEQLPKRSYFFSRWQEHLSEKGLGKQEDLFNAQPNLERILALKSELMSRSGKLQPSLQAAYGLIEGFEGRLEKLNGKSEFDALNGTGRELDEIHDLLKDAAPVRKTLCSSLRSAKYPVQEEVRGKSFRHAFCAAAMQAMLTDTERESESKTGSGPDWNRVLNSLFPKAELDNATRKPYDPKNLPVLQRLLATVETARIMTVYGMNEAWEADLEKTIHGHSDLHKYQSALARSRKMSQQYNLKFDTDGLVFHS